MTDRPAALELLDILLQPGTNDFLQLVSPPETARKHLIEKPEHIALGVMVMGQGEDMYKQLESFAASCTIANALSLYWKLLDLRKKVKRCGRHRVKPVDQLLSGIRNRLRNSVTQLPPHAESTTTTAGECSASQMHRDAEISTTDHLVPLEIVLEEAYRRALLEDLCEGRYALALLAYDHPTNIDEAAMPPHPRQQDYDSSQFNKWYHWQSRLPEYMLNDKTMRRWMKSVDVQLANPAQENLVELLGSVDEFVSEWSDDHDALLRVYADLKRFRMRLVMTSEMEKQLEQTIVMCRAKIPHLLRCLDEMYSSSVESFGTLLVHIRWSVDCGNYVYRLGSDPIFTPVSESAKAVADTQFVDAKIKKELLDFLQHLDFTHRSPPRCIATFAEVADLLSACHGKAAKANSSKFRLKYTLMESFTASKPAKAKEIGFRLWICLSRTPVDLRHSVHAQLLRSLQLLLCRAHQISPTPATVQSEVWALWGFQSSNPVLDLRGTNLAALLVMWYVAQSAAEQTRMLGERFCAAATAASRAILSQVEEGKGLPVVEPSPRVEYAHHDVLLACCQAAAAFLNFFSR